MIFYYSASGKLINSFIEKIYQGSNKANEIYFVAPVASTAMVTARFTLANKQITGATLLKLGTLEGVTDDDFKDFTVWKTDVLKNITEHAGKVKVQFEITFATTSQDNGTVIASEAVEFTVEEGVSPITAEEPAEDVYTQILALLSTEIGNLQKRQDMGVISNLSVTESEITYDTTEQLSFLKGNEEKSKEILSKRRIPVVAGENIKFTVKNDKNGIILDVKGEKIDCKLDKVQTKGAFKRAYVVDENGVQKTIDVANGNGKILLSVPQEDGMQKLYVCMADGSLSTVKYGSPAISAATVVQRTNSGQIKVYNPVENDDAASKEYVDSKAKTIYKHDISFCIGHAAGNCATIQGVVYKSDNTPINTKELFLQNIPNNITYCDINANGNAINVDTILINETEKVVTIRIKTPAAGNEQAIVNTFDDIFLSYSNGGFETIITVTDIVTEI